MPQPAPSPAPAPSHSYPHGVLETVFDYQCVMHETYRGTPEHPLAPPTHMRHDAIPRWQPYFDQCDDAAADGQPMPLPPGSLPPWPASCVYPFEDGYPSPALRGLADGA